jgi:DNA polymerase III subunit beta
MEISVNRNELVRELTATQGVIERKTTIPILSNFLFEAAGDALAVTATDLDLSLRTSCRAEVKKEGACTVPARKLFDYVKLLPDVSITLKLLENHWVSIRAGRSTTKMVGMARANFPALPEFPTVGGLNIPAKTLHTMIQKTIFAISSEESRYTLNGALLVLKPEAIAMVATDGHRLAHIENTTEKLAVSGERRPLIPKKAMHELLGLLQNTEAEAIEFAEDESTLFFRIGNRLLTSRKLTGQFPNYEAVLPRENNRLIMLNSEDMTSAVQRVAQFADERSHAIRVKVENNEVRLQANSNEMGEAEDVLETSYQGESMTIGFNSDYLIDFLKAAGTAEVRLELKDSQSAGMLRPTENGNGDEFKYRYVVMPMRI